MLDKIKGFFEKTDPTPRATPVKQRKAMTADERLRRILDYSNQKALADAGVETFEEADDFDIPDDPADPHALWEESLDHATVHAMNLGAVQEPGAPDPAALAALQAKMNEPDLTPLERAIFDDYIRRANKAPPEPPTEA